MERIDHASSRSGRTQRALRADQVKQERWSLAVAVVLAVVAAFGLLSLVVRSLLAHRALAAVLALGLLAGCTAAQLKAGEAVVASDLQTSGLILSGIAAKARANPGTLAQAAPIATAILSKVGVPASTAAKIGAALSEDNADKLGEAGDELQAAGSVIQGVVQ